MIRLERLEIRLKTIAVVIGNEAMGSCESISSLFDKVVLQEPHRGRCLTMKILQGDRGFGKTTRMISWFVEDPTRRGIIVPNSQQRLHVIKEVKRFFPHMETAKLRWDTGEYDWTRNIWTPANWSQRYGRDVNEIWIDNFDMLIGDLVGNASVTLTTSQEVEVEHLEDPSR